MPNGRSKNLVRLRSACAAYRARHDEWPAEARVDPIILRDLAHLLDDESFSALASRIRLRTKDTGGLSVGGARGVVQYGVEGFEEPSAELLTLSERWLGVAPRESDDR